TLATCRRCWTTGRGASPRTSMPSTCSTCRAAPRSTGLPAPRLPAVRSLVHAGRAVRGGRPEVPAALRRGGGETVPRASLGPRALRPRGAPCRARPLLDRARPLLAGRVLDQRGPRLRVEPGLPPPRPAGPLRQGLRRP